MSSLGEIIKRAWPYLAAILLQFGSAGMSVLCKFALDQGLSQHVLVVYRHALAFLIISPFALYYDRNPRPKMTPSILLKIMLIALLEPVIDQNLYYTGMKLTTATYTTALANVLPAFAFLVAWTFNLEKVDIRKIESQAKILGTLVSVGGAMMMTLVKGSMVKLPWIHEEGSPQNSQSASVAASISSSSSSSDSDHKLIYGALMIAIGCVCWSVFINLQAITLKSYPCQLSLTAWICLMGAMEGTAFALAIEWNNPSAWSIHWDSKLLAVLYSGVISSGVAYCVQGLILKAKGPVFLSSFGPLGMIIVAIMGSLFLGEQIYVGRVYGAIVIVIGLYMVLWGKSKDSHEVKSSPSNGSSFSTIKESTVDVDA